MICMSCNNDSPTGLLHCKCLEIMICISGDDRSFTSDDDLQILRDGNAIIIICFTVNPCFYEAKFPRLGLKVSQFSVNEIMLTLTYLS